MPYLKVVKPEHKCYKPSTSGKKAGIGSVWECPQCKKQWMLDQAASLGPPMRFAWYEMEESEYLPTPKECCQQ